MEIGARIKKYRLLSKMTQKELAEIIGVDDSFISVLENGKTVPSISRLLSIAESLNIRPGVLIDGWVND